jgi:hypothetical protein
MEHLKYPIGPLSFDKNHIQTDVQKWLNEIEDLPRLFNEKARSFTQTQLDTSYRPGGWTVRQVIHHVADSHMNACLSEAGMSFNRNIFSYKTQHPENPVQWLC